KHRELSLLVGVGRGMQRPAARATQSFSIADGLHSLRISGFRRVFLFSHAVETKAVAILIIAREGPQPKPMIIVFASWVFELLFPLVLARALITKKVAPIRQHLAAVSDFISLAAMDAD